MTNWYDNVPAPVDANGNEVPLDTRELVYKGETRDVLRIAYNVAIGRWVADLANTYEHQLISFCTLPDSWERLEKDAACGACHYFGMKRAEVCDGCPTKSNVDNLHVCYDAMTRDILRRAKALAGVTDGE